MWSWTCPNCGVTVFSKADYRAHVCSLPTAMPDITAQLDALEAAWKDSNRKMDNAAHRGDITAYMNERKENVRSIRAMRDALSTITAALADRADAATVAFDGSVMQCFCDDAHSASWHQQGCPQWDADADHALAPQPTHEEA